MSVSGETESGATTFGFTLGVSHTQSVWSDARHASWPRLVEMLTSHVPGGKEGPCIVPAVFTGDRRKKEEAAQIDVAFLDSDSGATLDQIVAALNARGWEAVVSSTHSHMTTHTEVSLTNWDRFFAKHPNSGPADFLEQDKGYLASVASGAAVTTTTEDRVHIEHAPCPKFRIAVPLAKPWRAADYPSQGHANGVWKERIEALAAALSLWHDQACTDTSRLFYLPRRPPNGAVPETAVVSGQFCDIFNIESAAAPDLLARPVNGKANGHSHPAPSGRFDYHDPITGEFIDLTDWARNCGPDFLIAKALGARRLGALTGLIVDNSKVHIRCPNEDAHTNPGQDNATFVVNAGNGDTKGFVIHCRHAHCTGNDRLFFVRKMLVERWLSIDDLTAPEFLLERDESHAEPPPDDSQDPGWLHSLEQSVLYEEGGSPAEVRAEVDETSAGMPELDGRIINPPLDWTAPAPLREWIVDGWIPRGYVTGLYGDGAVGKSLLAQQLLTACSTHTKWLGMDVHGGRAFGLMCEDDAKELHRRQESINRCGGLLMTNLSDLRLAARFGYDNLLMTFDERNRGTPTELFAQIGKFLLTFHPTLINLDTLADIFGGNEIVRAQARQFVQGIGGQLARQFNCGVVICAHPSAAGLSTGQGTGGSTAWSNTFRSRLYMTRPENEQDDSVRHLSRMKANYAPKGAELIMRWHEGAFVVGERTRVIELSDEFVQAIFTEIERRWVEKDPSSNAPQTRRQGRYIPLWAAVTLGVSEKFVAKKVDEWVAKGLLKSELVDAKSKTWGLRVVDRPQPQAV